MVVASWSPKPRRDQIRRSMGRVMKLVVEVDRGKGGDQSVRIWGISEVIGGDLTTDNQLY